jgi:hypothetical protein
LCRLYYPAVFKKERLARLWKTLWKGVQGCARFGAHCGVPSLKTSKPVIGTQPVKFLCEDKIVLMRSAPALVIAEGKHTVVNVFTSNVGSTTPLRLRNDVKFIHLA